MRPAIVIIDDEQTHLDLFRDIFEESDYEIHGFVNPFRAMEFIDEHEVAIVVTDNFMPQIEGADVIHMIKQKYPVIQIVLMTGFPTLELIARMVEIGAADFLIKPFEVSHVHKVIDQAFDRYERWQRIKGTYSRFKRKAG